MASSSTLSPGIVGNPVLVDGVPVTGANAPMPISSGALAGLATLRDETAPTYQAQLDEMARGLVESFAESDQSGGGGPDRAGLFTWSGGPAVPAAATLSAGIAGSLKVNSAVVPAEGGAISQAARRRHQRRAYKYNATGAGELCRPPHRPDRHPRRAARLRRRRRPRGLRQPDRFLPRLGRMAGRPAPERDRHRRLPERPVSRVQTALSNAVGVNLDDEYAQQLQLEQSYQASSKLINVVNTLFQTLLDAVA